MEKARSEKGKTVLMVVELITFTWYGKGTRESYIWGIQSSE
jgi:hypothetical protein